MKRATHRELMAMVRRNNGIVLKVCLAFSDRQSESIKDLYQDIMQDLCSGYHSFRSESEESTWVYRVALNRALRNHRSEHRRLRYVELTPELCDTLAVLAEADPLVERLYELIDLLAPTDKALILLYLDRCTTQQMAEICGCAEITIKKRIAKIREKLIKLNQNEE